MPTKKAKAVAAANDLQDSRRSVSMATPKAVRVTKCLRHVAPLPGEAWPAC